MCRRAAIQSSRVGRVEAAPEAQRTWGSVVMAAVRFWAGSGVWAIVVVRRHRVRKKKAGIVQDECMVMVADLCNGRGKTGD